MLVESIIATAVIGLVVVGGVILLTTIVRTSMTQQAIVRTSNEATIAAGFIDTLDYRPCQAGTATPTASTYQTDLNLGTDGRGYTPPDSSLAFSLEKVTYLSSSASPTASFVAQCPAAGDQGAQRLELRVTGQDSVGPISRDLVVIKRNEDCSGIPDAPKGQTC